MVTFKDEGNGQVSYTFYHRTYYSNPRTDPLDSSLKLFFKDAGKVYVSKWGDLIVRLKPNESQSITLTSGLPAYFNAVMIGKGLYKDQSIQFSTDARLGFKPPIYRNLGSDGIAPFSGAWSDTYHNQAPVKSQPQRLASMIGSEPLTSQAGEKIQVQTHSEATQISFTCRNYSNRTAWVPLRIYTGYHYWDRGYRDVIATMPDGTIPEKRVTISRGQLVLP